MLPPRMALVQVELEAASIDLAKPWAERALEEEPPVLPIHHLEVGWFRYEAIRV